MCCTLYEDGIFYFVSVCVPTFFSFQYFFSSFMHRKWWNNFFVWCKQYKTMAERATFSIFFPFLHNFRRKQNGVKKEWEWQWNGKKVHNIFCVPHMRIYDAVVGIICYFTLKKPNFLFGTTRKKVITENSENVNFHEKI